MRNKSLDAAKAIAACLVVFIHVSFPGQTGPIIKTLARCAVPFFFMVSGYFCYYGEKSAADKIPAKILHIFKLFVVSILFYFAWECLMKFLSGEEVGKWIRGLADSAHLKAFVLYNSTSPLRAHLWFLPALIYCYVTDWLIEKCKLRKVAYCCVPVLLVMLLWRAEFCRFFGGFYHTMEYRNFLFTGLGFYLAGQMLHEYQDRLQREASGKCLEWRLIGGIAVGVVTGIGEYLFQGGREIYAGNIITVISLFLWLILYGKERTVIPVMAETGRKYAFLIYLLHPAMADIVKKTAQVIKTENSLGYMWLRPVLVYVATLVVIQGILAISKYLKSCSQG